LPASAFKLGVAGNQRPPDATILQPTNAVSAAGNCGDFQVCVAVIQFGLVIASLYDEKFVIFKTTESLMMLVINGVQTYVAFRINSRSLVRTIAGGSVTG
jgi:hypothetical protein